MKVLLDISRTVARARLPQPTGIDRVERAYIGWALARSDTGFLTRVGRLIFLLGPDAVRSLVTWLDGDGTAPGLDLWGVMNPRRDPSLRRAQSLVRRHALARTTGRGLADMLRGAGWGGMARDRALYLNVGHDNLAPVTFDAIAKAGLARAVMLHDTIPLDHPEYARAGTPAGFRAKLTTALQAEALIANSAHTAERIAAHANGAAPPTHVLPLGLEPSAPMPAATNPQPPSYAILGTIEPRKNHAMLLDIWHGLFADKELEAPRLHIIGRRGWENHEVFDQLDNAPMMGQIVHEHGPLDDAAMRRILADARALLFPSLAEGYGLPLGEALQMKVPVIASDLPALRELGGSVPEWIAPHDGSAWRAAILDHAAPDAPARAAQMGRLEGWATPTWDAHFRRLENLMETILVQPVNGG